MRITLSSVFVEDQAKALEFYTKVLGFEKKMDIPMGEFSWLTVVSPDETEGTQLAGAEQQPGCEGVSEGDLWSGDSGDGF